MDLDQIFSYLDNMAKVEKILNGKRQEFTPLDNKETIRIMRDFGLEVPEWPNS